MKIIVELEAADIADNDAGVVMLAIAERLSRCALGVDTGDGLLFPQLVVNSVKRQSDKNAADRHYRFEAAKAAMMGLLADHKDHEDERKWHYVPCGPNDPAAEGVWQNSIITGYRKRVFAETCEQAVARLAVEHADQLLARLNS